MAWSKHKPTAPGFYWFRGKLDEQHYFEGPTILELHGEGQELFAKILRETEWPSIESAVGDWSEKLSIPYGKEVE